MNRHVRVFLGWPTETLGLCHCEVSAREENYAVICYDGDFAGHGFLMSTESGVAEVIKMWLMGESPEAIHEKVIAG